MSGSDPCASAQHGPLGSHPKDFTSRSCAAVLKIRPPRSFSHRSSSQSFLVSEQTVIRPESVRYIVNFRQEDFGGPWLLPAEKYQCDPAVRLYMHPGHGKAILYQMT